MTWLWFDVLRIRRYTLLRGLTIAFPEKSKDERVRLARQSLRHTCFNFPEILGLPHYTVAALDRLVTFEGWEHYENAAALGRGVLMLSLHLGNGDVAATATSLRGVKVHVITKRFKSPFWDRVWFSLRGRQGTQFIDAHGVRSAQEILAAAKRGEMVVFVTDQFIASPYGILTTFFGRKTGTATGLAKFALKLKAPIVPVSTYRDADLRLHIVFGPQVPVSATTPPGQIEAAVAQLTQACNSVLEGLIREHPEQWMWLHRRWKKFR